MTMIHREGIRFGIERKVGRALGRQWIEGSVFSENEIPRLFERYAVRLGPRPYMSEGRRRCMQGEDPQPEWRKQERNFI